MQYFAVKDVEATLAEAIASIEPFRGRIAEKRARLTTSQTEDSRTTSLEDLNPRFMHSKRKELRDEKLPER